MSLKITEQDFEEVSKLEGIPVALLKTVMEVEANGAGHLKDGRPKVLFEGHKFYKHLAGNPRLREVVIEQRPDLCFPKWTSKHYAKGANPDIRGDREWNRLAAAIAYDREAALKSASYGAFQIMGFNHKAAGFPRLQDFINAMYKGEKHHLLAVCKFIKSYTKMHRALLAKDWDTFALCYNGSGYASHAYHTRLEAAYELITRNLSA